MVKVVTIRFGRAPEGCARADVDEKATASRSAKPATRFTVSRTPAIMVPHLTTRETEVAKPGKVASENESQLALGYASGLAIGPGRVSGIVRRGAAAINAALALA
jgi:hypothetical protein